MRSDSYSVFCSPVISGSAMVRMPATSTQNSVLFTASTLASADLNWSVEARFDPDGASMTAFTNSTLVPNTTTLSVTA